ncbi:MAG TPA: hypothetical protein PKC39_12560 [Ferruginibacter sp.]|nr:hypothetical protein [Ferruginibacter sp.]HMP21783.1 hypothetical protein [Ferruginibacter sp.]
MKYKLSIALAVAACLLFFSCKKENSRTPPVVDPGSGIEYFNLHDTVVHYGSTPISFDFDGDGFSDLRFSVALIGDPILKQDIRTFRVSTGIHSKLAVSSNTEHIPMLPHGAVIPLEDFDGYQWWLVSSAILVERIENATGQIWWQGQWKDAKNKYLPFQLIDADTLKRYTGWVELTVDINTEKIILHRMALSRVAEKLVRAGEL